MLVSHYRHSPSSGNLYREAPDAFLWKYGFGRREDPNGKMAAGTAAEFAAAQVLLNTVQESDLADCALLKFDEQTAGVVFPEREDVPALAKSVLDGLRAIDKPLMTYQHKLTLNAGERYGLKYPVIGYTDFSFTDLTVDCKVTWRLPSEAKFSHVCQLGTYHALSGKQQALLYVSPKKRTRIELPEETLRSGFATMLSTWQRIEALAEAFKTPEAAVKVIAHNADSYFWSDAARKEAATIWNIAA